MTKLEAIELMRQGVRMTHDYFALDEWVYIGKDGQYVLEDGIEADPFEFWRHRTVEGWLTGWQRWINFKDGK